MRTTALAAFLLFANIAVAQETKKPLPAKPAGEELSGSWKHLQETPAADPNEARIQAPSGFHVGVFAKGLEHARMLLTLDDGTVLLSRPKQNDVLALRDRDSDGRADEISTVASALERPHGLAIQGTRLYIAGETKVYTVDRQADGSWAKPKTIVSDLPSGGQHPYRTIGVGRDGLLYVSIGSTCNDCAESNPEHAAMLQMEPDGSNRRIFASGLRNTIGFDWSPQTGELWGADHGSDWRGDDLPPEEINRIVDGANYGWPLCFGKQVIDNTRPDPPGTTREKVCGESKPALLELPAHAAPIAFAFYRGEQFPAEYRADAFAAWRGSWNRESPREPKIARIKFKDGKPVGTEDFVTGFVLPGGKHNGRLSGLGFARDGALLFTDDTNGVIYRVAYGPPPPTTSSVATPVAADSLRKVFKAESFKAPESVLHDEDQDIYFVSNMDGLPLVKDGKGFISKLSPDGKIEKLKFIDGLNAPKGLAFRGNELWVTDIDVLRAFDRTSGKVVRTIDLKPQGAIFLNDIALGGDGNLYVTDMAVTYDENGGKRRTKSDRIFRVDANNAATIVLQSEALRAPNGIVWSGDHFVIAQNYGKDLLNWKPGSAPTILGKGPGVYDGLVALRDGTVLVSSHHDHAIHIVRDGEIKPLLPEGPTPADIGYDAVRGYLLIPSLQGDWVEAWKLR